MKKSILYLLSLVLASFVAFPLVRSLFGDGNYPPLDPMVRSIYLVVIGAAFVLFGILLFLENRQKEKAISFKEKIVLAVLLGLIVSMAAPVFSIDFHCYIMQGRIMSVYDQNPYITKMGAFPEDPFSEGLFWYERTTQYGPIWVLVSAATTFIAGNSYFWSLVLLKLVLFGSYMLLIFQGYYLCSKVFPQRKDAVTTFLAFNPFIIVHYLLDGHNDILMMALAVWGINLIYNKKRIAGFFVFAASMFVKYMTALALPFIFLIDYMHTASIKRVLRNIAIFCIITVILGSISYLPFLANGGIETFNAFKGHKLSPGSVEIDSNTLVFAYLLPFQKAGLLNGIDLFKPPIAFKYVMHICFLFGVMLVFLYAWVRKEGKRTLFTSSSAVFMLYFMFESFSFGAWFLIWLLPFLIVSDMKKSLLLAYLLSMAGAFAFWKRLSFLLIAFLFLYILIIAVDMCRPKLNGNRG